MPAPVRFPNGVTNVGPTSPYYMLPRDNPMRFHTFFDDFNLYTAGSWTGTATGVATNAASTSANYGVLTMTNSTGTTDQNELQYSLANCAAVSGKQFWLATRVTSTATQANFGWFVGLAVTDTSVLASLPTDIIGFRKATGGASIVGTIGTSSTETTATMGTAVSGTYNELAMYYNGSNAIELFLDGVKVNTITTLTNLPSANLKVTLASINATAGAANVLSVDYFTWINER